MRDPNATIEQMLQAATAKTGENITISRFVRFKLGESADSHGASRRPFRERRRRTDL